MVKRSGKRPSGSAGSDNAAKVGKSDRERRDILRETCGPLKKKLEQRSKMNPAELLTQAEELLRTGRPNEALPVATRALNAVYDCSSPYTVACLPALNLLGEINLAIGNAEAARENFEQAVDLDPQGTVPEADGGGAEKFLWLAQLSQEGGEDSIQLFERGALILRRDIAAVAAREKTKKLASVLCGIIEVYMTDLSFEENAEAKCESLITEALLVAPHSPEPLQTLASIRISQTRIAEARRALTDSMALWKELPPEDIPEFPTRISLARLLMEVEMEEEALEVLERLVNEDDQSVEAWYLGGWCLYLLGQKLVNSTAEDTVMHDEKQDREHEKQVHTASLVSSREWLQQCLKLYHSLEYEDERLGDHAAVLVERLDRDLEGQDIDQDEDGGDAVDEEAESEEEGADVDEDHEMDEP